MRKYRRQIEQAKEKAANRERLSLEAQLPMSELIAGVRDDIEAFAAELGLTLIQRVMEAEIQQKLGPWGQQLVSRHGHQPGYVIFGGRKVTWSDPGCAAVRTKRSAWPVIKPSKRMENSNKRWRDN